MSNTSQHLRTIRDTEPVPEPAAEPVTSPTLCALPGKADPTDTVEPLAASPTTDPAELQPLPTQISGPPPAYPAPGLPVTFPGYEILGELGRGGMGVVYQARQRNLNRLVALKVIIAGPHASAADKARFRLEAEAGARLRHPNIVQVFDIGEHDGYGYIAFELVEGNTLRKWQNGRPTDPREAARLIATLARAVQHAHDNGIIHRDIKPANILLAGTESRDSGSRADVELAGLSATDPGPRTLNLVPKITDFGLAKALDSGADLTGTGLACGTPNYMAPEQVRGGAPVGPTVDVYGLGAVLYELLTSRPPFTGWNGAQVMTKILRGDPDPVRRVRPDVPRDLGVVVAKCLERDPARRYVSAAEVADDLERFLAGRPILARPVGSLERSWRWCRRNRIVAGLLLITTIGCSVTGAMAVALAQSVAVERAARHTAEQATRETEVQRQTAERVRDQLSDALAKAETDRQTAEHATSAADAARRVADHDRATAIAQTAIATQERKRAEGNLKLARSVLRNTLREFAAHPRFKEHDFFDLRAKLLRTTAALYHQIEPLAGDDPDTLADLAEYAHWMGLLAYLNGNMPEAAAGYLASSATCCRWAAADPTDPEARVHMAEGFLNAGRALYHDGRYADAEARFRDCLVLLESVADEHPRVESYAARLVRAYAPLYELLREQKRWADGEEVCRAYLRRAQDLLHLAGPMIEYGALLASAHQCLGQMLDRTGGFAEAECHLLEAVSLRDRVGSAARWTVERTDEAARTRFALAQHYLFTGRPLPACDELVRAITFQDKVVRALPGNTGAQTSLVDWTVLLAELLRQARAFPAAEVRYDAAIVRLEGLLNRDSPPPTARAAWATAVTGRAHLYNLTGRHREAASEWERLAKADPNERKRPNHQLFVLQSLMFAGNWREAAQGAARLSTGEPSPALLADVARVWCRISRAAANAPDLSPGERRGEAEWAVANAVWCLEEAKKGGVFRTAGSIQVFETERDYDPVRDKFRPRE